MGVSEKKGRETDNRGLGAESRGIKRRTKRPRECMGARRACSQMVELYGSQRLGEGKQTDPWQKRFRVKDITKNAGMSHGTE